MAAPGKWKMYQACKANIGNGLIDLDSHTFKVGLFLSTSNCDTLSTGTGLLADLTNQHANANGYTTGGATLGSVTWGQVSGTATFDSADPSWTASGGSIIARFAVIYDSTATGSPLVAVSLLDTAPADVTATAGQVITLQIDASGIFTSSGMTSN